MDKKTMVLMACGALAASIGQAALVKEWNFNTAGDVEGWAGRIEADYAYAVPVQKTSINGVDGVMSMASAMVAAAGTAQADPQAIYAPDMALADFGTQYTGWEKIVFRVRQIAVGGAASAAWNISGTTAVILPDTPTSPAGTYGPGSSSAVITYEEQADNWLLCTWNISDVGAANITNIRIDFLGNDANAGKNMEVDYVQLYAIPEPATLGMVAAVGAGVLFIRRRFMI